jgi:pimeloyl-ACP methyl ester carboxylesterase
MATTFRSRGIALFDLVAANNALVKLIVINDPGHFVSRERPDQFHADLIQFIEYSNSNTHPSRAQ